MSTPFDKDIIPFPDAGKDKFTELLYTRKFLKKAKLRTHEECWFVYEKAV